MADYGTLLVTTDLSDASLEALRQADRLADRFGSKLILAYVVDDRLPPMISAHTSDPAALLEQHREHAEKALQQQTAQNLPGKQVESLIRVGTVHEEIVKLAIERKVDLIVMSMHGHGYLGHALLGSTTERVLHHAPCPVLVVPNG